MTSIDEFKESLLSLHDTRKHRISGSVGVYDIYKKLRKNKWMGLPRPLTEHEFYTIIRSVNKLLGQEILEGRDINLPCRMGRIELRKHQTGVKIVNGKLKTNLPVNWKETIKLWYEDNEAFNNKTVIRHNNKEVFRAYYNTYHANYNNKSFFQFILNRDLKRALTDKIKNNEIDAFELWHGKI